MALKRLKMKIRKIYYLSIAAASVAILLGGYFHQAHSQSPNPIWSKQFGTSSDDGATAIIVDGQNNVFVTGYTGGSLYQATSGGSDAFIVRYNANGTNAWSKQFGTGISDEIATIAKDNTGNIYVGGATFGNISGTNLGSSDAILVKYDSNGNQLWAKQIGTSTDDGINQISLDGQGNVIAVGSTKGSLFSANTGPDNNGNAVSDSFVVKYDSSGNQLWGYQFGADDYDRASGVATDSQGNIFVVGSTSVGSNKQLFAPISGNSNAYLAKFSASGVLLWGKQFADQATCVSVDNGGNVYVGGSMNSVPTDNEGITGSGFISKFDGNGNLIWNNSIGSNGEDVHCVALDNQGNIFATGTTSASLFGPNAGDIDLFLIKYTSTGNVLWQEQEGTSDTDNVRGICVDNSGYVYLAGNTQGALFATNAGGKDAFIQRINSSGQTASANLHKLSPYKPLLFAWSGLTINLSYPPLLANKKPYVYAGYLCSGIPGAKVQKLAAGRLAILGHNRQVVIDPHSRTYQINGKPRQMSAKPVLVNGQCYVPLDVMKAVLPYPVSYEAKRQRVRFDPPQKKVAHL
jgi:hypothetical protein